MSLSSKWPPPESNGTTSSRPNYNKLVDASLFSSKRGLLKRKWRKRSLLRPILMTMMVPHQDLVMISTKKSRSRCPTILMSRSPSRICLKMNVSMSLTCSLKPSAEFLTETMLVTLVSCGVKLSFNFKPEIWRNFVANSMNSTSLFVRSD